MGWLTGWLGGDDSSYFGGDADDAAKEAAQAQAAAYGMGIEEIRRQYDQMVARLDPAYQRGLGFYDSVNQASTAGGLDARLGEIFGGGTFRNLQDERMRAVQNQLNQSGMSRSDAGLSRVAAVPTDLGFALEQMLYGRQMEAVNSSQNAAAGLGAAGMQTGANIANLYSRSGDASAQGIIGGQQAQAAQQQGFMNLALAGASLFFSDPRLKTNVRKIGQIGKLGLYQWDWIDAMPKWAKRMNIGFLTTEVKAHYPQHVFDVHGFDAVNYPALTQELEAA